MINSRVDKINFGWVDPVFSEGVNHAVSASIDGAIGDVEIFYTEKRYYYASGQLNFSG